ncbi:MAG TPA: endospore germination permease [Peptococcaceae bacterium]|nr:endospore germination permease [Peptococcaceae bacterium]
MIKEGKFGFREAFALLTIMEITKIFYTSPHVIIKELGTAAWYATLISCLTSLLFFGLVYLLLKRFPGNDLYQVFEAATGPKLGKILILIFGVYFLYYAGVNMGEFTIILKVYSKRLTPTEILTVAFLFVLIAQAYVGLEGIARTAYVFFFFIMGGLLLIILLAIPAYELDYLKPWLGYGLDKTILIGILRSSAYDEIIVLAIIINSIHGLKNFKKVGITCLIFTGLTFSICLACILAAFQYTVASEHLSGMFQLSRIIYYSRFFQRVEAIFLFIWVFASLITVSLAFYMALSSYCRAFKINNHRPLLLPFAFLAFTVASWPDNVAEVLEIHVKLIRQYSFLILYFLPLLVLAWSLITGKKGGKASGENQNAKLENAGQGN